MDIRSRAVVFFGALALLRRTLLPAPPERTIEGLSAMLGEAAQGVVRPADIAWEPSPGIGIEVLWGRRVLFLSSPNPGGPRDLFRARVRLTIEGRPVSVFGVVNLTSTPIGDELGLVIDEEQAAFAASSYGHVDSVSLLRLAGSPEDPEDSSLLDTAMRAVSNWQETGSPRGIGRVDVAFESPEDRVALAFAADGSLVVTRSDNRRLLVDPRAAGIVPEDSGARAMAVPVLRKRPILWAVDTVRAEVGPEPIAWMEERAFGLRDFWRRGAYALFGSNSDVVFAKPREPVAPPPPVLDASGAVADTSEWPPRPIAPIWKNPEPGEGVWEAVAYPWLKRLPIPQAPGLAAPPAYFYRTTTRPDPDRPYAKVLIVAMDMRQIEMDMEAGVEDPKPLTGNRGAGKIPRDPKILNRVVGAFNGAFKTTHGEYGMMVDRRVLLPPRPGAATLVVTRDRRVGMGTWGASTEVPQDLLSFRQNLEPLVEDGRLLPSGRTQWGWQLPGTSMMTERSGACVTASGQVRYVWGDEVSAMTLGKAMTSAGCTYGMHLDMNPHHTGFVFASVRSYANKDYDVKLLTPKMEIMAERYLEWSPKDFFYLMLRDPVPAGDVAWNPDVGAQPAPAWLPAIWHGMVQIAGGESAATQVELWAFDPERITWRVRTATRKARGPGATETIGDSRDGEVVSAELQGDDARRVMAALGLGNPPGQKDARTSEAKGVLAIRATDGRILVGEDGTLGIGAESDARASGETAVPVPLVLDDGKVLLAARERRSMRRRGAVCVAPSGLALVAMATASSDDPAGQALLRAGCARAVSLDGGSHRPTFLHRAGAGSPPLARYDESVLYAISKPMPPRAFRWNQ
jgi:hypothetical protein